MKRIILFSTALVFFIASQASAAVVVNDDVKLTTGINPGAQSATSGGPFLAQIYADAPNTTVDNTPAAGPIAEFYTFCVQHSENLATWNNLDGLTAGSTVGTPRLLTGYAAWAYNKFTVDSINTPGAAPGQISSPLAADVNKLIGYQKAIWAGMINGPLASATSQIGTGASDNDTGSGTAGLSGGVYAAAGVQWSDFIAGTWQGYNSLSDPTGSIRAGLIGNALIMNLSNGSGTPTQDMVIVNAGSLGVPEPASLAVWSILAGGAAGLSVARRRRAATRGRWSHDNREAILSVIEGKHGH